ncbi:MAG: mechanosensitive ion channel family protein [Leptospiraceae bacterium]|nr:mechanosensitive ion channel [Leptospiraceae bacterium]MCK6380682.1 mechanosensitive ion channel family protein [Leptospiraceae bacterium]NUM42630.1 mechanosensitive ion channel [Leptospiraceae bacterium]
MKLEDYSIFNPFYLISNKNRDFAEEILLYVYSIILVYLGVKLVIFILDRIKPTVETADMYNRRRIGRITFVIMSIIILFPVFFSRIEYLPTLLGLTSVGFIVSMKEVTLNLVGWVMIHGSNGFEVGDRIEVDGFRGDVINIGMMRFTLIELNREYDSDQSSNRLIHFPNHSAVLQKVIVVSQKMDFVWDEMRIHLSIDSNWQKAEELCNKILRNEFVLDHRLLEEKTRELSKNYLVRLGKTTPIVYTTIEEGEILLSLRYLTPIREKRWKRSAVSKEVLISFKDHEDIQII